ncbi:hypothetical protein BH11ARM1_BH11ARM1_14150 [soil metagenome]
MPLAFLIAPLILGQSSTTLKYLPPIGKVIKYSYVTKTSSSGMPGGQNMNMTTTANMSIKALSRKGDVTSVETIMSGLKMVAPPGSQMAAQLKAGNASSKPTTSITRVTSSYKLVGIDSPDAKSKQTMDAASAAMAGMSFPTHPVKVGDTWSTEIDFSKVAGQGMGAGMMKGTIPVKLKVISLTGTTVTISTVMNGTTNMEMPAGPNGQTGKMSMKIVSVGTSAIKISDGTLLNTKMDMTMTMSIMSMNIATKVSMSMKRLG